MNRESFAADGKLPEPYKPSFIPVSFERGDKVINLEVLYTDNGYFEKGCEFMCNGIDKDRGGIRMIVRPITNDEIDETFPQWDYLFPCCFKIVEKGWMYRKYPNE